VHFCNPSAPTQPDFKITTGHKKDFRLLLTYTLHSIFCPAVQFHKSLLRYLPKQRTDSGKQQFLLMHIAT